MENEKEPHIAIASHDHGNPLLAAVRVLCAGELRYQGQGEQGRSTWRLSMRVWRFGRYTMNEYSITALPPRRRDLLRGPPRSGAGLVAADL